MQEGDGLGGDRASHGESESTPPRNGALTGEERDGAGPTDARCSASPSLRNGTLGRMRILPDLPDLHILPAEALRPHEPQEDRRAAPLAEARRREGVLRNPPIVLRLSGHEERYIVLDGANRTNAFQQLGFKYVLAQVVHPGDNQIGVETWNHAVLNLTQDELLAGLRDLDQAELRESDAEQATADMIHGTALAYLSLPSNRVMSVAATIPDLHSRVAGLNRLVQAYQSRGRVAPTHTP